MPKRIPITLLLTVGVAIVALLTATNVWAAACTSTEENNYECSDDNGKFEVRIIPPFPNIKPCSDYSDPVACSAGNPSGKYSEYQYQITNLTTPGASHFNLIIEKPFEQKILGGFLDCDGSGDASTCLRFAHGLTWNCVYKESSLSGNVMNFYINVKGENSSAPSDWYIKAGNDPDCTDSVTPDGWGIIQAPSLPCAAAIEPGQPVTKSESFATPWVTFDILFDADGKSFDVVPTCGGCSVVTVSNLGDLRFGDTAGTVTWFPYDTPVSASASPDCTYVRTRSGAVKKICP
jgi:hypothetical protein